MKHNWIWILIIVFSCTPPKEKQGSTSFITSELYGITGDGREVTEYTLTNSNGASVTILNYGGTIISIKVPDKNGELGDVVLSYDSLAQYQQWGWFGSMVGRFSNRIAGGKFTLDGVEYELEKNNEPNNLHSGSHAMDKAIWDVEEIETDHGVGIVLSYISPNMSSGFPGNLDTKITYLWREDNAIEITYEASTDKKTVVNFTNHSYFNLGDHKNDILDHQLEIKAKKYLPVDETKIPTGALAPVKGTPFDFTKAKSVGRDISEAHEQIKIGGGYDHCWVIDDWDNTLRLAATLFAPETGRIMETYTTEPGVQVYSANHLDRKAICLETQHFPDSPNQPAFPSTVLSPGEKFKSTTVYKFGIKR